MSCSERVSRLREMMITVPAICLERARFMTESYRRTESQPDIVRRAMALDEILRRMTVRIEEGELLVGWPTSKIRGGALLPEINGGWVVEELDSLSTREWDRYAELSAQERGLLLEISEYWKGKSLYERWLALLPEDMLKYDHTIMASGGFAENGHHWAHAAVNYPRLLSVGSLGIVAEAEQRLATLDCAVLEDMEKRQFWKAVKIVHGGLVAFSERYATLAGEMASREPDARRRAELERIAQTCRRVPARPARTFYEALQSAWILYVALMIEGWGAGMTLGRVDQYLYPYYRRDVDEGRLTREEAMELVSLLLVKMNAAINLQSRKVTEIKGGYPVMQGLTLGGISPDGRDAVNELSYLFLDAEEDVGLSSEDIVVRVHRSNPDSFVVRACEVAKGLGGKLKFVSDETSIASMLYRGLPLDRARDYISTGCHNPTVPAYSRDIAGTGINYGLVMELALNDGVSRLSGERLGPATGDPRSFASFDEVLGAFKRQAAAALEVALAYKNADLQVMSRVPCPLQSSLYDPCVERGRDVYCGGTWPHIVQTTSAMGAANVGDSLAAIRRVVFDDRRASMARLVDALDRDFAGDEELLAWLAAAPKFGNDDDYVDLLLRDVLNFVCDYLGGRKSFAGASSGTACLTMTSNIPFGKVTGALPDGRRAGRPLSEGGISPYQGRNVSGATATLRSVAKLDQVRLANGTILNMRISADSVKDGQKMRKFATMLRSFCEDGGNLVQFNFTSNATLKDAQLHPENYRDLLVRVATYSAYFVELSAELQDDIISRTEFSEA